MLGKLFESLMSPIIIPKREKAGIEARRIACLSIIGYNLSGDESFAKLATLGTEIREFLDSQQHTSDAHLSSIVDNLKNMRSKLDFLEEQHGLRDRIRRAYFVLSSGVLDIGKSAHGDSPTEETESHRIIQMFWIASDKEYESWPEEAVLAAQCAFGLNGVPSYITLCNNFGRVAVDSVFLLELHPERNAILEKIEKSMEKFVEIRALNR